MTCPPKTGIMAVTTTFLVTMDGDDQHCVEDIVKVFCAAIEQDSDLVVGDRGKIIQEYLLDCRSPKI